MKDEPRSSGEFLDAGWEARARATLERAGYDPDLGVSAARDALRVTAGELTEDEFRRRHHEAYVRQFGADERPLPASGAGTAVRGTEEGSERGGESGGESQGGRPGEEKAEPPARLSRRTAMRLAGGGAAALLLGQFLLRSSARASAEPDAQDASSAPAEGREADTGDRPVRWGMVIDLERCTGCMACVDGCHEENGLSEGVHWIHVIPFVDENRDDANFLVRPCMHCSNAPCVKVCPVAARHVRESDGLVLTDYDVCIGCRYCEVACPYGANYFQWADPATYGGGYDGERRDVRGRAVIGSPPMGVMGKCTFCPQRVDVEDTRGTAACVLACPHDALHIGDFNDPLSAPRLYLERRRQENPSLSTFRLLDELGTEPNVIYIGQEPSERAEPVEGPTSYGDWGFVSDRRAVLEGPEPWFLRMVKGG